MYVVFALVGLAWAAINVNSLPMVVEMCRGSDIGRFTGYYYTFSMVAQVVTPIAAGSLMRAIDYRVLFPYAAIPLDCFAAHTPIIDFVCCMENRVYGHNSGAQNPPMQKAAAFCPQRPLLSTKIPHFLHLFHIHVLECFQPLLCLRLRVAVADEADREQSSVWRKLQHKGKARGSRWRASKTRSNRRDDLRNHTKTCSSSL